MLQWWIDLLQCPANARTCDYITLISKNYYSTAFAAWCNYYKINELLLDILFFKSSKYFSIVQLAALISTFIANFAERNHYVRFILTEKP